MRAGYRLVAPLPFSRVDTENEFQSESDLALFRTLLEYADSVTERSGSRETLVSRESAFAAVGLITLDNCDVLLAVWDGRSARGTGGTAEVVANAQSRSKPVIWIAVDTPYELTIIDPNNRLDSGVKRQLSRLSVPAQTE